MPDTPGIVEPELVIKQQLLSPAQYVNETTKKTQIVIHTTSGSYRPDYVVQGWEADPSRIATHFVIGGLSISGDTTWDGVVVQAVPEDKYAYSLGVKGAVNQGNILDKSCIGVELCNWSYLVKSKTGEFLNYVNKPIPPAQVTTLDKPYRGYVYYHSITDRQLVSLKQLIQGLCKRHGIVLEQGKVFSDVDFEFDPVRASKQSVTFHSCYRETGKWDCPPLPNLVKMLNELHVVA